MIELTPDAPDPLRGRPTHSVRTQCLVTSMSVLESLRRSGLLATQRVDLSPSPSPGPGRAAANATLVDEQVKGCGSHPCRISESYLVPPLSLERLSRDSGQSASVSVSVSVSSACGHWHAAWNAARRLLELRGG